MLFVALIGFSACNKDKEKTCNLETENISPDNMPVIFVATQTGDGVISSLTYEISGNSNTVVNPGLPWTITEDAVAGTNVRIIATGKTTNGSLTISFHGQTNNSTVSGSDFCSDNND